ncbi:kynurenine formamidase [Paraburkholderia tropica]|nr:kynurenine formamidase [Paraburkholderia tropica]
MPRFVDLSIYLENDVLSDPPPLAPRIEYQKHTETMDTFLQLLPGTKPEDYPEQQAAAAEWVSLSTHSGTHLDAPYHFHSTQDAKLGDKKPSTTIDEVPLDWCFRPGVKLDFRHFPDGYVATAADV